MDLIRRGFHAHSNTHVSQYDPLDATRNEIRLLRLLPARFRASRIRGEHFISLKDDPLHGYEALSYVWGHPAKSAGIWIDDRRFGITKNLELALKDIRPKHDEKPLMIWVDDLCIDQENTEERGHQVQLMRKVYSDAVCTRAWLDINVDASSAPFREITTHGSFIDLATYSVDFWGPVIRVFRDQYWSRLWVQQEMLLARKVRVNFRTRLVADHNFLPFVSISSGLGRVDIYGYRAAEVYDRIIALSDISSRLEMIFIHDVSPDSINFSLLQLYFGSNGLGSLDVGDHLFGFLGIANHITPEDITIDYESDPLVVLVQIPNWFLHRYNNL